MSFDLGEIGGTSADQPTAMDCGRAVERFGLPELHLARLDPADVERVVGFAAIRFDPRTFARRSEANKVLTADVQEFIKDHRGGHEPGSFIRLFDNAKRDARVPLAIFDAEIEVTSWFGQIATIVFLSPMSALDRHLARAARNGTFRIEPVASFTLSSAAMADLVDSWHELAQRYG